MVIKISQAVHAEIIPTVELLTYPAVTAPPMPTWEAFGVGNSQDGPPAGSPCSAAADGDESRCEALREEELGRSFEKGRERGLQEGRAMEREAMAAALKAR